MENEDGDGIYYSRLGKRILLLSRENINAQKRNTMNSQVWVKKTRETKNVIDAMNRRQEAD